MRLSARHGSAAFGVVGCILLQAALAAWPLTAAAQPAAPDPCSNSCTPFEASPVYTVILLTDVGGRCGITPANKGKVRKLEGLPLSWVTWGICSTCPYDAEVTLDRWSAPLTDILQTSIPQSVGSGIPQQVPRCSTASISAQIRPGADPDIHDFKISVRTGTTIVDADPQLQIRDPGRWKLRLWVLLGALVGLGGGVMLGRFLWRARR